MKNKQNYNLSLVGLLVIGVFAYLQYLIWMAPLTDGWLYLFFAAVGTLMFTCGVFGYDYRRWREDRGKVK